MYDETESALHEYQVKGATFTKMDCPSDDMGKPADERGYNGESKSCLVYPSTHTVFMSFAHQRWTGGLCERISTDSEKRARWMRQVNLSQFQSTHTHPDACLSSQLGEFVADVGAGHASTELFNQSCTPLAPLVDSPREFNQLADKARSSESSYLIDLPDLDEGW
ncbi:putative membrane protein [Vibrio astriarenae]|nr:putative membrane protein [Vibrio sp. C7]